MDGCAVWNTNNTAEPCVGAAWVGGNYGPDGVGAGCQCYYKWDMPGSGDSFEGICSGKLVSIGNTQSVIISTIDETSDVVEHYELR